MGTRYVPAMSEAAVRIPAATASGSWSAQLWSAIEPIYASILEHPFITGLTDGTLDSDAFTHYVAQDVHYLRDYARALAIVGAKAPTLESTAVFSRHAAEIFDVEMQLHNELLPQLGLDAEQLNEIPVAPTTRAYTSYLLATAYSGSFADGLAAVLPCYWIYGEVGKELARRGSTDPRYRLWIDNYGGEEFWAGVDAAIAATDATGPTLTAEQEATARAHFVTTSRYEWMFFDAGYRREQWPV